MDQFIKLIISLVSEKNLLVSQHGYDELKDDNIRVIDIIQGINDSIAIEFYPDYFKGPCILVLQKDSDNNPLHVVWGIPKDKSSPAVLVTSYRPDTARWNNDFTRRQK